MRRPFIQDEHNSAFARNGYVLVRNALSAGALEALFPENYNAFKSYRDFHFTSHDTPDSAIKDDVIDRIAGLLAGPVSGILREYRPVVSSFHVKLPDKRSDLKLHQNPTFVDEAFFSSIVCWAPLQDVDQTNGTVYIIPGTHRMFRTYRVANFTEEAWLDKAAGRIIRKHGVPIPMAAGDLLFFDDAVFHGSYPNRSDKVRISIAQVNIPAESDLLTCRKSGRRVELSKVPDDYYERMSEPDYLANSPELKPYAEYEWSAVQRQLRYSDFKSLYDYYF